MTVLFVCSGNTCRSPMAAALCRARRPDWIVLSAGLSVLAPLPASPHAAAAVKPYGGDLTGHLSRPVDAAMLDASDLVVPMTSAHGRLLRERFPNCAGKLSILGEIADPFGGDFDEYAACAARIADMVSRL